MNKEGKPFSTPLNILSYEVFEAISDIPKRDGKYFENMKVVKFPYIQHIPECVLTAQKNFLSICKRELNIDMLPTDNFTKMCFEPDRTKLKGVRQSAIGNIIDDCRNTVLSDAWYQFRCIDEFFREWKAPNLALQNEVGMSDRNDRNTVCVNENFPELVSYFRNKKIEAIIDGK